MQILRCDPEYEITNLIKVAFEKRTDNYDRCKYVSDFLDQAYGGCWRVIIGQNFKTCGTFYCQQLIRVLYQNEQVEIFKTQGDLQFDIIEKDPKIAPQTEEAILQSIHSAQAIMQNYQDHPEYIAALLESKLQGHWAVISGFDYNCRLPYVHNNYISLAVKGTRYTVVMLSK